MGTSLVMINMTNKIEKSNVLVTGGTGSFGNKVAALISKFNPNSVTILSRDENKQYEMRKKYPDFKYVIADVRDYERLKEATKGIDIIFNAAALKQVPSCELYPEEAIKTNTLGALNICRAAIENQVHTVIGLSTDKAVKPINAMGMSKALMEKIICSYGRKYGGFCCVRYGNVMGSRGSVIPLFRQQIERKEPLTITVPEMTRFMLTLDQAIELVIYAVNNCKGGEIFVKKASACRMDFLAKCMIKKYASEDNEDNEDISMSSQTKIIGIRAGEKLHETLINEYEMLFADDIGGYYRISEDIEKNIIFGRVIDSKGYIEYTSNNTRQITDYNELSDLLDKSVTEETELI